MPYLHSLRKKQGLWANPYKNPNKKTRNDKKMSNDLVDILLATYNTNEQYLKEQIDSLLNQTHKNIKIYISDDASNNKNTIKTLEEYSNKDERIKLYMHEKNIGFNANFEFLLSQSTAQYIMFCDHDDIWYNNKVEKSLDKIKATGTSLVYVNCRQVTENIELINDNYFKFKNIPLIKGKNKLAISRYAGLGCSQIITKEVKLRLIY